MPDLVIRPATPEDAAGIAAVHVGSWQAAYAGLLPDEFLSRLSIATREQFWASNLADPSRPHTVLAASADGGITGFAVFGPSRDDDATPSTGELSSIYLLPSEWGRGMGRALHEECVRGLSAQYEAATLWVLSTNTRARKFYERAGWVTDGKTKVETISDGAVTLEEVRYRLPLEG
ncbi:GNAT family N-acetyltransferase [Amycolatopsis echigonensis]|uniref:L-amino acid N-acyltransferase YncA n=1 Tax=Amycolatopsis echigonensis TaxID=2576905 RepID=A0A2N3WBB5_9PSEU|nr:MULTISPECIES: GNAT family N-acetyltransferase [Amycolatopsis]PKV91170.1 L-amino acid N-acyltransferase YncA [Amycolatopsis niigatensis]